MNNQKIVELKKQQVYLEGELVELERKRKIKKTWRIIAIVMIPCGFIFEIFISPKLAGLPAPLSIVLSIPFWIMGFWKFKHLQVEYKKVKKQIQDTKIEIIDAEA